MNPDSTQQSNSNPANYTVVPGDNLYDIARSNGVTLQQIEAANPQIANFDVIHPGDIINLPAATAATSAAAPAASGSSYTVVPGDNLSAIAQVHGQSLQDIESANPQIANPDLIHPGDVINLGTGGSTPAPAAPTDPTATPSPTDTSGGGTSSVTSPPPTTPGASVDPNQQTTSNTSGGSGTSSSPSTSTTDNSNPSSAVTGGGSTSSTTDTNQTPASPTGSSSPPAGSIVSGAAPGDPTLLGDTSPQPMTTQGAEMSRFPSSSSYSVAGSAQEVADVAKELGGASPQGWPDAGGSTPQDVAKTVFEEPSHPSTDPLDINDKTDKPAG